jgi:eukaryotic-like serine/threonine-protein kinase
VAITPQDQPTAAQSLEGEELEGGWRVLERVERPPGHTGGNFSVCYRVVDGEGRPAFLKVLDYSAALAHADDPAETLNAMTSAFLFEVEVLRLTASKNLSRVVRALDSGATAIVLPGGSQSERINYLIFEVADGDVRDAIDAAELIDDAWKLRMLHHATTGARQLHGSDIAHQDLKPSNVLVFNRGEEAKVADLGCASLRGTSSPRDGVVIAGDRTYAPPEQLYGHEEPDWRRRRLACDLYHLGSLGVFLFAGQGMTALLMARLPESHRPGAWGDRYSDLLPFIRVAFDEIWVEVKKDLPAVIRDELAARLRELTDPDPALRGHLLNRNQNQFALDRFVSAFDYLSRKTERAIRLGK